LNRDLSSNIKNAQGLVPVAPGTGATNGLGIDTQGFDSCAFVANIDGTAVGTWKLQESDDDATYTDAVADDVIGTQGAAIVNNAKLGYVGSKRYVRAVPNLTTDGVISISAILSNASQRKVS
jgi:hypothetical protein